jgi:alkylation response protein AidB-like acyl-CoA dehydrogenase
MSAESDRATQSERMTALREEVRAVIAESGVPLHARCDAWMRGHDTAFSARLADRGLIGVSWPREYGGRGASSVERLVITEELLRVGAPVAAHWIADRQIGPAILRYGSPELKERFLPGIASGRITFCLGMSETEAGSDLAALRTRAVADGDVFRLTGRKIWTSHAHRSTHAYVLARTGDGADRHEALTEFVVDLAADGVKVHPIYDLAGEHHFNETIFENVEVPATNVIGTIGDGWHQVTEQLAFERGGMERVLSTYPLLARILAEVPTAEPRALGTLVARLHTLRAMALGIADAMDAGRSPLQQAAAAKFLGTAFEGDVVEFARDTVGISPDPAADGIEALLAESIMAVPGTTLRGGATEVLLGIIAKQALAAAPSRTAASSELAGVVAEALSGVERTPGELGPCWKLAVDLGWTGIGSPEDAGGSGGGLRDLADLAAALAASAQSAPVTDAALAALIRVAAGRGAAPASVTALALGPGISADAAGGGFVLRGQVARVPWARAASSVIVAARCGQGELLFEVSITDGGVSVEHGSNLAAEPRDTVGFADVHVPASAQRGGQGEVYRARGEAVLLRAAATAGAMRAAAAAAREHARVRHQFGRPLATFQAVAHLIARMAAGQAAAEAALEQGLAEAEAGGPGWRIAAAALVGASAATNVARPAHQVLGAMGITREHELHLFTLRLWSWRDELVAEKVLAGRLGAAAAAAGHEGTWSWIVHEADGLAQHSPWSWT